jgi:hypothetical protein
MCSVPYSAVLVELVISGVGGSLAGAYTRSLFSST